MASLLDDTTLVTFSLFNNETENVPIRNSFSEHLPNVIRNKSFQNDCILVSDMEFLPWDNPDNFVSEEVETTARRIKNNLLVLLFLIGGPSNMINMAVFYKQGFRDRVNVCLFALSLTDELTLLSATWHYGEQFHIQFTTKVRFGPIATTLSDNNLYFISGFCYVSYVLSATIATERCLCVYSPLKFQRLLSTKTMVTFIIVLYVLVMSLFFLVAYKYRVVCVYDPVLDLTKITSTDGEFYKAHKDVIDPLESFVFGVGLPGVVMIVVMTTTLMTIVKLRQTVKWRSESSSSISARELAVTKILVVNSIFFVTCLFPIAVNRFSWLFFPEIRSRRRNHNAFLMSVWITEMLTYINATFNIFIYFSMGSRYRETFWALFRRKLQPKKAVKKSW